MHRILLAIGLTLLAPGAAPATEWTHWRGPLQNGFSPDKNLPSSWSPDPKAEGNNLLWHAHYGCRSTPLVMNDRVYIINYTSEKNADGSDKAETIQERVMCLDFNNGKKIWEHTFNVFHTDIVTIRLGWTNLAADPATGYIYAHGTQGFLMCLDGKDGKVIWQRSLTEEYGRVTGYGGRVTSPTVDGDLCIIGMLNSSWGDQAKGSNRWVAFDKKTGVVRWWADPGTQQKGTYYSTPVCATINGIRQLITGGSDGSVYGFKVNTGEKIWEYNFGDAAINSSPVVDGNLVYIGHGEESSDTNVQGRVICVDASKVKDGQPDLVWKVDGIKARYSSPILDKENNRIYFCDDVAVMTALDLKTGERLWKKAYGSNARGSGVMADGKIYIGDVFSLFLILKPSTEPKKVPNSKGFEVLHEHQFAAVNGASVEVNGSPAIAKGRVIIPTSDEIYCIGLKGAAAATKSVIEEKPVPGPLGEPSHLQIVPADVTGLNGEKIEFKARLFDAKGNFLKETTAEWSLPQPPLPPGAKMAPPPLDGSIKDGVLTLESKKPAQQGYVMAKLGKLVGKARVRMTAKLSYEPNFANIPLGAVPGGWVNTQGKFLITEVDGKKVLSKVNDKAPPPLARANAYMGLPSMSDYTTQADIMGTKKNDNLPEMGVGANRYSLILQGNTQKLRLLSWDALPRIEATIPYKIDPGTWYTMKITTEIQGNKGTVMGKVWPRGTVEPKEWTIQVDDPRPNREGSPALFGYVLGVLENSPGTDIHYDNVKVTSNKK